MNKINVFCFGFGQTAKSFVKKITIEGKAKKNSVKIKFGKIFFENGDRYEGEIEYDMPQGKGTMYYKENGTHFEGEWVNGNLKEN